MQLMLGPSTSNYEDTKCVLHVDGQFRQNIWSKSGHDYETKNVSIVSLSFFLKCFPRKAVYFTLQKFCQCRVLTLVNIQTNLRGCSLMMSCTEGGEGGFGKKFFAMTFVISVPFHLLSFLEQHLVYGSCNKSDL